MFRFSRFIRCAAVAAVLTLVGATAAQAANAEGQLDPHFGVGGKVLVDLEQNDYGNAVAVQPDGKIVVAGTMVDSLGTPHVGVIRLLPNGNLDPAFDGDGKIDFYASPDKMVVRALALQPDGKIVVAGYYQTSDSVGRTFFAMRIKGNGSFDGGFGNYASRIRVGFGYGYAEANSIALASDGSIYLGGDVRREFSFGGQTIQDFDFAVVKLTSAGQPDTGFGDQGKLTIAFNQGGDDMDTGTAIALQSDGKVLLAGRVRKDAQSDEFGLVRFSAAGVPETGFGNLPQSGFDAKPGQSVFDVTGYHCHQGTSSIAVWQHFFPTFTRRIFVGGTACYLGSTTIGVVAAVQDDGTLDSSFGSSGTKLVNLDPDYEAQHLTALVLQPPSPSAISFLLAPRVLVIGHGYSMQHTNDDMLVSRLDFNGSVDTTFGNAGHQSVYFDYAQELGADHALSGAMYRNGFLLMAGSSARNGSGDTDIAVTRLLVGDDIFHDGFELLL